MTVFSVKPSLSDTTLIPQRGNPEWQRNLSSKDRSSEPPIMRKSLIVLNLL